AEDHANARAFAGRIAGVPGILVEPERVQTNIVFFDVAGTGLGAPEIARRLEAERGVRIGAMDGRLMRAVTHLDVSAGQAIEAAEAVAEVAGGAR
ncbi:MAG TPA: hypothetical protein VFG47_12175, partial [Geminicoccaceae bacterium]|nr:hypothetical protein [Geminicoccaceae bacterium]